MPPAKKPDTPKKIVRKERPRISELIPAENAVGMTSPTQQYVERAGLAGNNIIQPRNFEERSEVKTPISSKHATSNQQSNAQAA